MKQQMQLILLLVLVLVVGVTGYRLLFGTTESATITVLSQDGEVILIGSGGAQLQAGIGDSISVHDSLRTGKDGNLVLGMGENSQIHLAPASSIRVLSADLAGFRVELDEGKVFARVRPGSPSLGISSRGRAINAVDADFTVAVDVEGAMAIEPERGTVSLQGMDGVKQVEAGQRVTDLPGRSAVSAPIPNELLLKVAWPKIAVTRAREIPIRGKTGPYAAVQVGAGGHVSRLRAGPNGGFHAKIPIQEGENTVEVQVIDPMGVRTTRTHSLIRDSTAPVVETEVQWDR